LSETKFYDIERVVTMANIALNGNVTGDNTVVPFTASRAVDGIIEATHRWVANTPCGLTLTLPAKKVINRWVVSGMSRVTGWPAPGWTAPRYSICDYVLQGRNSTAENWTNLDSVSSNQVPTTDRTLVTPANYQYYRVYVTKGLNCNNKVASIMDFQLYEAPPSSPYLSALTISSGTLTPIFAKNTYTYTASVGYDVNSITVTPTAEVPTIAGLNATIKVNGVTVASGAGTPVALTVGTNTINIDVTSAIGNITQRYTLTVTKTDSNYLSGLVLMNGTTTIPLNTAFAPATASYTASVGFDVTSLTVTATKQSPNASITINGSPATSGQAFTVSNLAVGTNTITVAVTTPGMTVQNYTVVVTRASSPYLQNITVKSGMTSYTIAPTFVSSTYQYSTTIGKNIVSVNVAALAGESSQKITINGVSASSGQAIPVTTNVGDTLVNIVVSSGTGSDSRTYVVKVTRPTT
jgi:hypothetical protein